MATLAPRSGADKLSNTPATTAPSLEVKPAESMQELRHHELSWLPNNSHDQLNYGFRVIYHAYKTHVDSAEAENRALRATADQHKNALNALQKRFNGMELEMLEHSQRASALYEENQRLVSTVKKLQKDIVRLESLKKAVLNSLQTGDLEDELEKIHQKEEILSSVAPRTLGEMRGALDFMPVFAEDRNTSANIQNGPKDANNGSNAATGNVSVFAKLKSRLPEHQFRSIVYILKANYYRNKGVTRIEELLPELQEWLGEGNADLLEELRETMKRGAVHPAPISAAGGTMHHK